MLKTALATAAVIGVCAAIYKHVRMVVDSHIRVEGEALTKRMLAVAAVDVYERLDGRISPTQIREVKEAFEGAMRRRYNGCAPDFKDA